MDHGGAYIKLLPGGSKFDAAKFGGEDPYGVMFGPDICGSSNKKTHVILHYDKKDENLLIKKDVSTKTDDFSHLYTLIVKSNNTLKVLIDNKSVRNGKLEDGVTLLILSAFDIMVDSCCVAMVSKATNSDTGEVDK